LAIGSVILVGLAIGNPSAALGETAGDWKSKADAAFKSKSFQQAVEYYSKALELNPESHELIFSRGLSYFRLKKFDEALQDFSKAKDGKDLADKALNGIGLIYYQKGDYKKAEDFFREANEIRKNSTYCVNAALAAHKSGNTSEAIKYCLEASKLDPKNEKARETLQKISKELKEKRKQAELAQTVDKSGMFSSVETWKRIEKLRDKVLASVPSDMKKSFLELPANWRKDDYMWKFEELKLDVDCVDSNRLCYLATHTMLPTFFGTDPGSRASTGNQLLVIMIGLGGMGTKCSFEDSDLMENLYYSFNSLCRHWQSPYGLAGAKRHKMLEKFEELVKQAHTVVEPAGDAGAK
jgi:tetratricopeptide (TPR) repeat protein